MGVTVSNTDHSIYRGEDKTFSFTVTATDASISGWTMKMTVRRSYDSPTVLIGKSGTVTDATAKTVTATVLRADTETLEPRAYVYTLERTDSANRSVTHVGIFTLLPPVALA